MDENYNLQVIVPLYQVTNNPNANEYLDHLKRHLMKRGADEVFNEIYKQNNPVVVETHIETWEDHYNIEPLLKMRLHYRLTAVQNRHVEIPVFSFINHNNVEEWKCPACAMINIIEATFCGERHINAAGCGRPRDKTRQEYEKNPFPL